MGKKKNKKRKHSSSSSSSSSSSESQHSSSNSSSNSSGDEGREAASKKQQQDAQKQNMEASAMSMFMETKPDELIEQIFIILDEAEIKDLCPAIIKHFNMEELKEKCLKTVMNLDESGLQSVYETQAIDPDTEEIDRALIQLGLVGHTPVVSSGPSKWITVKEEVLEEEPGEVASVETPVVEEGGENESIFDEPHRAPTPPPKEPELPRRLQLADKAPEATEDAEMWRAMLMKDREKLSRNLDTSVMAIKREEEMVVKEEDDEEGVDVTDDMREGSPLVGNPPLVPELVGNPPLIGNPPLMESPSKPRLSYRARAEMKAKENASSESESGSSSSSEEGEISEGEEEEVKERVRMKSEGEIESGEEKEEGEEEIEASSSSMLVSGTVLAAEQHMEERTAKRSYSDEGEVGSDEGEIVSEEEGPAPQDKEEDEAANYAL